MVNMSKQCSLPKAFTVEDLLSGNIIWSGMSSPTRIAGNTWTGTILIASALMDLALLSISYMSSLL